MKAKSARRWKEVTPEEIEKMRKLRKRGMPIHEIAKFLKRHHTTVDRHLQGRIFCQKYQIWIRGCPIKGITSNNCFVINCPLRGEKNVRGIRYENK